MQAVKFTLHQSEWRRRCSLVPAKSRRKKLRRSTSLDVSPQLVLKFLTALLLQPAAHEPLVTSLWRTRRRWPRPQEVCPSNDSPKKRSRRSRSSAFMRLQHWTRCSNPCPEASTILPSVPYQLLTSTARHASSTHTTAPVIPATSIYHSLVIIRSTSIPLYDCYERNASTVTNSDCLEYKYT